MATTEQAATVGFISPPRWHDPAPYEFPQICAGEPRTQQTILPFPDFDYRLESVAASRTLDALVIGARSLAAAGSDVIVQVGTPFAWAGLSSEREARDRCSALEDAAGVPVVMTGLAIIDALRALGARAPALACTYYDAAWRDGWVDFVRRCGFEPTHVSTLADQGLVPAGNTLETHRFSMTPELTEDSIQHTARDAPNADAIVVTGTGSRTFGLGPVFEMGAQKPLIGADTVIYWAAACLLGLPLARHAFGALGNVTLPRPTK